MQAVRNAYARAKRAPSTVLSAVVALAAGVYVIGYPLTRADYPPMTDLPFHAAHVSILRHFFDADWHFREQFSFHPLEVPYVTMYGIGWLLALILPLGWAVKAMAFVMLALLPIGLAVLFWGMHKSAAWGVIGLGLVWSTLSHWGFLSFVGAVGLQAMSVGLTLRVVERPSRALQLALCSCLLGTLFTHVSRFPFAVAGVLVAAAAVYPMTRTLRPLLAPLAPPFVAFAVWLAVRPPELRVPILPGLPKFNRLAEFGSAVIGGFHGHVGDAERRIAISMLAILVAIGVAASLTRIIWRSGSASDKFSFAARGACVILALGHVLAFLTLPEHAGKWWYIYPREALPAVLFAIPALPDFPTHQVRWAHARAAAITLIAFAAARMGHLVAAEYAAFQAQTADFRAIIAHIPRAPKLFYLIFDRGNGEQNQSPYIHLPAWVQAEKGGWLHFHFAGWGIFPLRYRLGGAIPPMFKQRSEWMPQDFRVEDVKFFDTFLVRHHRADPGVLFARDPTIQSVARAGDWFLYQRRPRR